MYPGDVKTADVGAKGGQTVRRRLEHPKAASVWFNVTVTLSTLAMTVHDYILKKLCFGHVSPKVPPPCLVKVV